MSSDEVDLKVKYKDAVLDFVDIPVDISNRELLSQVVMDFNPKLKLPEKKELNLVRRNYTLKKHHMKYGGGVIRGVLELEGDGQKGRAESDDIELKNRLKEMESDVETLKNDLTAANAKVEAEKKKVEAEKKKVEAEREKVKKKTAEVETLKAEIEKLKREKTGSKGQIGKGRVRREVILEMEQQSSTVPRGYKFHHGILVPQNVVFEMNERWRSRLEKTFSNGNKVARGIGGFNIACFKTSAVFTAGKKFYFQVSANVGNGGSMGFGILSGEVTKDYVGNHEKGWSYHCFPGGTPKRTHHSKKASSGYGPERTKGKHKFGIFCDFTDGKGEVSFIVNGKNWGVAYKNVEPPVSPAFYIELSGDSFKIEDSYDVPDCM